MTGFSRPRQEGESDCAQSWRREDGSIAVLHSGDPVCYGVRQTRTFVPWLMRSFCAPSVLVDDVFLRKQYA